MLISRQDARSLGDKIKAAVQEVLDAEGYELGKVSSSYGDVFSIKLTASPLNRNEDGVNTTSAEAMNFARFHASYGLPADALGKEFRSNGKDFRFAGINPNAPKRPFLATSLGDGRTYVFHDTPSMRAKLGGTTPVPTGIVVAAPPRT